MALHPKRVRCVAAVAATVLCVGAAGIPTDRALVVTAIADDVEAVVLRHGSTEPVAYAVGETVQGTRWRVIRVRNGEATLRNAQAYKGSPLEVRLRVGQRLERGGAGEGNKSPATEGDVDER